MKVDHTDHSDEDELLLPLSLGVFPVDVIVIIILFQIYHIIFPGDVSSPQFLDPHRCSHQAHCALLRSRRRLPAAAVCALSVLKGSCKKMVPLEIASLPSAQRPRWR